jgi:lipopolysaccharide export system protein LptA
MRWQRVAQAAIALFVIGFIALLATTLRKERRPPPDQTPPERSHPNDPLENPHGGTQEVTDPSGKQVWSVKFGSHVSLADGRQQLGGGVTATINRGDRQFLINSRDAEVTPATDGVKEAIFRGDVRVTGTGLEVRGAEARYTQADGMMTMPGRVEFTKGRTTGSGVGATYDQTREIFWIQQNAVVKVAPAKDGSGALDATAAAIGMARQEHYIRLQGNGRIAGEGRIAQAEEIVIHLTDDDERVRTLELRGNSRIEGTSGGAQSMSARDIDMTYAEDGRTLRQTRLVDNAVVQLPGASGAAGKRIVGTTIDLSLGADGSTITGLVANDQVQVDLPAEADAPARRIRSTTLNASGPDTGLQSATFGGGVEFRETRPARRNVAAIDRTATSQTLIAETKPGLGAIQKADFRGNVKFTEPPDFVAEAAQGIYDLAHDRLDLVPATGLPGPPTPTVTDGNVSVAARTIQFGLTTRELSAETKVRSTIQPQKNRRPGQGKVPSVLSGDEPVNVTSDRLAYKGRDSAAVYTGAVTLWQGNDTSIKGETITIDDKTGNLGAEGKVATSFIVEDAAAKSLEGRRVPTTGTSDTFSYDDAKRLATYTGKAHIVGPQGDVVGNKIELFMKAGSNELERAEAYGANGEVQVTEGKRIAKGLHLTYTAADDLYLMIGTPVEIVEEKDGKCTRTLGATARFNRTTDQASVAGSGNKIQMNILTLKECPAGLGR